VAADTTGTAPAVVRTSPANGATGVPVNPAVEVEYTEALDAATVTGANVGLRLQSGSTVVGSTVSLVGGGRVIRVVPTSPLAASTGYFVEVTSGVRDLQGTPAPFEDLLNFTTGTASDGVAPTVLGVAPPDGATGVGVNALIVVTFSEAVNPLTVSGSTIRVTGGGFTVVPASVSFTGSNTQVTVTPVQPLPDTTELTISVSGVEDVAGHAVTPFTSSFTTSAGVVLP